jgi:hypothetical protein
MHYCAFLRVARWLGADTYAAKTRAWRLQVVAGRSVLPCAYEAAFRSACCACPPYANANP